MWSMFMISAMRWGRCV